MKIRTTDALVQFCAEQCLAFNPQVWEVQSHDDTLRAVAHYLAQTSWYGHEEELERIAGQAADSCDVFANQEGSTAFADLVNFSVTVRCRIAALQGKYPKYSEQDLGACAKMSSTDSALSSRRAWEVRGRGLLRA